MAFTLPPLPYDKGALVPHMSAETLEFHHGKHHQTYVDKTNTLAGEAGKSSMGLVELIQSAGGKGPLFNNAAQLWNHSFFWLCLSPAQTTPSAALQQKIDASFGSTDEVIRQLADKATSHFASGWGWLVLDGDAIKVADYHDGDSPIAHGVAPLFTVDVWEHAYYIDYRNARPKYLEAVLKNLINWQFVEQNLDGKGADRADQRGG